MKVKRPLAKPAIACTASDCRPISSDRKTTKALLLSSYKPRSVFIRFTLAEILSYHFSSVPQRFKIKETILKTEPSIDLLRISFGAHTEIQRKSYAKIRIRSGENPSQLQAIYLAYALKLSN